VGGQRGYRLARAGKPVDLPATPVTVSSLELLSWVPPVVTFRAVVSAGTYIRSLARDLGERLGTGGHLRALRRERIGDLRVEEAVPLEGVGPGTPLRPPLEVLGHLVPVPVTAAEEALVRHGRPVAATGAEGFGALVAEGRLVAVAEGVDGQWQPRVVLEPA
jgi:tRNA pseudouridine55 synthase